MVTSSDMSSVVAAFGARRSSASPLAWTPRISARQEANAFMKGPHFGANPIAVEFDPEDWRTRLRAGAPVSDFPVRQTDEPVSPIRGSMFK